MIRDTDIYKLTWIAYGNGTMVAMELFYMVVSEKSNFIASGILTSLRINLGKVN